MPEGQESKELQVLKEYDRHKYNVLVPTAIVQQISPFHQARLEVVQLSPNPEDGDVYYIGKTQVYKQGDEGRKTKVEVPVYAPAKPALMKIAHAAGIVWNWGECKRLDDHRDVDYVSFQAVGAIRKTNGEWVPLKATKEIDIRVIAEELAIQYEEKADDLISAKKLQPAERDAWIKKNLRKAVVQWRKHKLRRCETGAYLAVIRAALSLKHAYTKDELLRPFIVPRVDFAPDYNDPEVRRLIMTQGLKATAELFGGTPALMAGQEIQSTQTQAFNTPEMPPVSDIPDVSNEPPSSFDVGEDTDPEDVSGDMGDIDDIPADIPGMDDFSEPPDPEDFGQGSLFRGGSGEGAELTCSSCGTKISSKVAEYSKKHHGRYLCFDCQKRGV